MYKSVFLKWWLIFGLVVVGTGISWATGAIKNLYNNDASYLSIAIICLFFYMSAWCGTKTWKATRKSPEIDKLKRQEDVGWFASDLCMGMGMVGTLFGFVLMLKHFHAVNVANQSSVQDFIKTFGSGMGTALYTTLVGLIASLLLKIQYFNLGLYLNKLQKGCHEE